MKDRLKNRFDKTIASAKGAIKSDLGVSVKETVTSACKSDIGKSVLGGAAAGAIVGSAVPLVGTAFGANVGVAIGVYKYITKE